MQDRVHGRRRLALGEVGSTNATALAAAQAGDPGPLWVTADRQLAGRGRRGRAWDSPAGNLYASLLLIDPSSLENLANLPLVVAVGVHDGLGKLAGIDAARLRLKWPNDVLLDGAKCVGILIESERLANGTMAVVAGFGVNVVVAPDAGPTYRTMSLRDAGGPSDLGLVFAALADGVEAALAHWRRGNSFGRIRDAWLEAATGLGERCMVNLPDRSVSGRFVGLERDGRLILEAEGGSRTTYSAGDVFFAARP